MIYDGRFGDVDDDAAATASRNSAIQRERAHANTNSVERYARLRDLQLAASSTRTKKYLRICESRHMLFLASTVEI